MTLRHFRIFIAVCEAGSMTAAAAQLFMTQPPVSQAIAEMESHYGIKLFDRLGRNIYLTPAGTTLRSYASHILSLSGEIESQLADLSKTGSLRIGASMTIGTAMLPYMIKSFLTTHPKAHIEAVVDNSATIIHLLNVAKLDIGLVEGLGHWPDIVSLPFYDDELALICPPDHPWAALPTITVGQLAGKNFVVREEGSGTREVFESAMKATGINYHLVGIFNNSEAIVNAVACGIGLALVSRLAIQDAVALGKVGSTRVAGLDVKRQFNLVYHKNKFLSPQLSDFIQLCENFCQLPLC